MTLSSTLLLRCVNNKRVEYIYYMCSNKKCKKHIENLVTKAID